VITAGLPGTEADDEFWRDCGKGLPLLFLSQPRPRSEAPGRTEAKWIRGFRLGIAASRAAVRPNEAVHLTLLFNNCGKKPISMLEMEKGNVGFYDGTRFFRKPVSPSADICSVEVRPGATLTYSITYSWDRPGVYKVYFVISYGWSGESPGKFVAPMDVYGMRPPEHAPRTHVLKITVRERAGPVGQAQPASRGLTQFLDELRYCCIRVRYAVEAGRRHEEVSQWADALAGLARDLASAARHTRSKRSPSTEREGLLRMCLKGAFVDANRHGFAYLAKQIEESAEEIRDASREADIVKATREWTELEHYIQPLAEIVEKGASPVTRKELEERMAGEWESIRRILKWPVPNPRFIHRRCEHIEESAQFIAKMAFDRSTPEATVVSFTQAAARGEKCAALACFLPGGTDFEDIREVLNATPWSSRCQMKQMLESLDTDAPMPIVSKEETPRGAKVVWRVTFKEEFKTKKGLVFEPGMTHDLDATLKRHGDRWLIDGF